MPKKNPSTVESSNPTKTGKMPASMKTGSTAPVDAADRVNALQAEKLQATHAMASSMPFNANKASEHGYDNGTAPPAGATVSHTSRMVTSSTLSEVVTSAKTGTQAK